MSYQEGFKDAVGLFEDSINENITKGIKTREDMIHAMDSIISTLYIAKLSINVKEEERLENLLSQIGDCDEDCDNCDISDVMDDSITKLLADIFGVKNSKEAK